MARAKKELVAVLGFHDGSAGQIATWFEETTGYHIACFVNEAVAPLEIDVAAENRRRVSQRLEYPTRDSFKGRPLITSLQWAKELRARGIGKVLPLTPNNRERFSQIQTCRENGIELVSAIHPTATVLADALIESGVWVSARAIVGYKAEIAAGVLINTGAQIDHHNVLRTCCQVAPAVVTGGNVTLEECAQLYTGAVIVNRRTIGHDSIIGAGAVVIDDIPAGSTAVGVPARVIKHHAVSNTGTKP